MKQSQVKMHFFIVVFPYLFVCGIRFPVVPNEEGGRNSSGHEPSSSLLKREKGTADFNLKTRKNL
jgi:hypothetical protein